MKQSCRWCGRIHDSRFDCGKRPKQRRVIRDEEAGRYSEAWKRKSRKVKEDCNHLCQYCLENGEYTYEDLEAHHIEPLIEGGALLDDDNIVVLCRRHHELAESGEIDRETLKKLALKRNESPPCLLVF